MYDAELAVVAHGAFVICADRLVAAEIAQEAFAVALASWPRVAAMERPGAWVRRVAINLALKERRHRDRIAPDDALEDAAVATGRVDLARAIERLPTPQRLAIVLHDFHDLSEAEVADSLGCAENTATVHRHRARQALAPVLDAGGMTDGELGTVVKVALREEFQAVTEVVAPQPTLPSGWARPTMVFVASPALGPTSLAPTAAAVEALGYATTTVDLSDVADLSLPRWRAAAGRIAAAVYAISGPVVLVGHGQAGPLLVPVAELRRVAGLILVDSALPPLSGEVSTLPVGLAEALADQVVDGRLPPWETWWPQCALEFLVEDRDLRDRLRAELPALPASYAEEEIPIGARWRSLPAAYLRLSLVRESEATFAGMRGMVVERLSGDHLFTATEPEAVAAKLATLMDALEPAMI